MKNLTEGKPIKLIINFAIPLFIGLLFQLFYTLVDTRIVGSYLGEHSLAAVGSTTTMLDLLYQAMMGLTNGFAIIVATYFGAKRFNDVKKAVFGTVFLGTIGALLISIICFIFADSVLAFLNVSYDIAGEAKIYFKILTAGFLASALYNAFAGILRAIGDSLTPLIFLIISSLLNIGLDLFFINSMHMGVAGAAYATVISQAVSFILCCIYAYQKYPLLRLKLVDTKISAEMIFSLLKTGISMSFMLSFVFLGTVALQTSINTFGTSTIVAHTAARKATSIFMLPFTAFGTTLATYCGQNLGAGKYDRIRKGIKDTTLLVFVWCTFVIIAAFTISKVIVVMITGMDVKEVIDTATLYLKVNTVFYYVPAVICLFRNSMQGFGDSKTPIVSSFIELVGKVMIALFLAPKIGYMGIIISEPIVWVLMVIPLVVGMLTNPIIRKKSDV